MNGRRVRRGIIVALVVLLAVIILGSMTWADLLGPRGGCFVQSYHDLNCNGAWEREKEPPLPGVCVWTGWLPWPPSAAYCQDPQHQTDAEGLWGSASGRSVVVRPPEGFEPTADTVGECPTEMFGLIPFFGFAPTRTCPPRDIVTAEELYRQRIGSWLVTGAVVLALAGAFVFLLRRLRATGSS